MRVAIVAGEASGDYLAAGLIRSLRTRQPDLQVEGVGGEQMRQAGCTLLYPLDRLAVMGLVEVLGSYFGLLRLRRRLAARFLRDPPDLFIGVDAPDFNLGLEEKLRRRGVRTVHYVSPSVWAWRGYRVRKIARAVDLLLALFPFEQEFYKRHRIPIAFVGHPLADRLPLHPDRAGARQRLGLAGQGTLIALMPGSRRRELKAMLPPMLQTADWCLGRRPDLGFVSSVLTREAEDMVHAAREAAGLSSLPLTVFRDRTEDVLAAADAALLTSGTVTLEAMLLKRPMVVTYRVNRLSYPLLRRLIRVDHVALPNILCGREVVPEFLQQDCVPGKMGPALLDWLADENKVRELEAAFLDVHRQLRRNASDSAAAAILSRFAAQ
jgi:lipid-A-disaccharide synthase